MKKKIQIVICCLLCFLMAACSGEKEKKGQSDEVADIVLSDKQSDMALQFVKDLTQRKYDKLQKDYAYDEQMHKAVREDSFQKQLDAYNDSLGSLIEAEQPYGQSYQNSTIIMIPCRMEEQNTNIQLSLNEQDQIQGLFFKPYKSQKKAAKAPDGVKEREDELQIADGKKLSGRLTTPAEGKSFPLVILLAGSGPNDMDETIYDNKPFQDIAWGLAKKGIASYRYDKRTYTYPESFTVKDTVEQEVIFDAVAAFSQMKQQKQIDTNKIYILGHSLSGYLIPRIAAETDGCAGYIMMAAPARALDELLMEQVTYLAKLDGNLTKDEQAAIDQYKQDQQDLQRIDELSDAKIFFGGMSKAYMKDLLSYDAVQQAADIKVPVLCAQGLRDYQVTEEDQAIWRKNFETHKNWIFTTYPNATHLMIDGEGTPTNEEYKTKGHVNQAFIEDMASFIKK